MPLFSMSGDGSGPAGGNPAPQQIPMSPAQIADYTALVRSPHTQPADLEGWASAQGHTMTNAADILSFMRQNPQASPGNHFQMGAPTPSNPPQASGPGLATRLMGSLNEGMADTIGQPVDLVNSALKWTGLPMPDKPFMGSDWISSQMHGWNLGAFNKSYAPQSQPEGYGQQIARGVGQAAFEPFGYGKAITQGLEHAAAPFAAK